MTDTTLLFLPSGDDGYRWWRLAGERVVARGEGVPAPDPDGDLVAVPPGDAVTLHWAELPSRSPAQAAAAARLLVADASAAPIAELHVAVGAADGADGAEQPIGVVAAAQMRAWLLSLAEAGVDPDRVVPAPLLLPRPAEGYVRGEIGGQGVVRGATSGFADEARLTDLVTGDRPPMSLGRDELEGALAAALAGPALNLRQGAFARRRRAGVDWALVRRLGWLALAILTITLAADLVRIARYDIAAAAAEARADSLARAALPSGETANDPDRQLDERLAGLRGPGRGFTATAALVFAAIRLVPGTEATAMDWSATGELRVSVATQTQGQAAALRDAIARTGLAVTAGTFADVGGRLTGDLTVRAR